MAVLLGQSGRARSVALTRGATLALEAERRAATRAPLALRVDVRQAADGPVLARVWSVDVSLGGLLLAGLPQSVAGADDRLWLTIDLGDDVPLDVRARVARRTRAGRVGVALELLGPGDRGRLARRLTARF